MQNGAYPDTIYDKDLKTFRIVRSWDAGKNDGSIIVENGSTRGLRLVRGEFSLRRFTNLLDADGLPIYEGDLLSVGMRVGDDTGWTTEVVAWCGETGEWGLVDQATRTEFMSMQRDPRLRRLTGESVYEVRDSSDTCAHCGEALTDDWHQGWGGTRGTNDAPYYCTEKCYREAGEIVIINCP